MSSTVSIVAPVVWKMSYYGSSPPASRCLHGIFTDGSRSITCSFSQLSYAISSPQQGERAIITTLEAPPAALEGLDGTHIIA